MNTGISTRRTHGMTFIEVLVVVAVLVLLAAVLLPALTKARRPARRIPCVNNLKQISLAFIVWSNERADSFPWNVSVTNRPAGTAELAESSYTWLHFRTITNELPDPGVLACPSDSSRSKATAWRDIAGNEHLSYFLGLEADMTKPQTILSGDRNIRSASQPTNGILRLSAGQTVEWSPELHQLRGNIAIADGSVQQLSQNNLHRLIESEFSVYTNRPILRLAIPE